MRVRTITYAMLRVGRPFENDRVEAAVELEPGDTIDDAILEAKRICERALTLAPATQPPAGRRRPPQVDEATRLKQERPIEPYDDPGGWSR